jgi:hypothetical protein
MAAGEYVSVHSQADTEQADLALERAELKADDKGGHKELMAIYVARGLDPPLAKKVADQLMAHDALGAHARDELGISETLRARPIQAAMASAGSFAGVWASSGSLEPHPDGATERNLSGSARSSNARILVSGNILPRAAKQNGTILIRVFFEDGHHKDKAFEVFKPENARDCVIRILRPCRTATDRITRYVCYGRVVLAGRQHANCILDNRPPSPGLRPVSKHVGSYDAVFQAANKTFLSLRQIGCQQERKQMQTIHVFCEYSAKLDARCVRLRCLSRDRRSSWHGQLCPLCSIAPQR